ncbi:hypothetical protein HOT36_gp13 [Ralstonia phage RPSC1]|uniref:Uncharacterized protein n=1 Tax=Ralstonia phage RPSC1 TaxID=2041351 RepID=A0A2Z2U7W1_9CAUD|nr:hypothetical protein HOT36_gp13 [Ralstonia phage RPSC1]ATN92943.1 hypothetical protein RPSC1_12 [Ralstonia phage RPSC1]
MEVTLFLVICLAAAIWMGMLAILAFT